MIFGAGAKSNVPNETVATGATALAGTQLQPEEFEYMLARANYFIALERAAQVVQMDDWENLLPAVKAWQEAREIWERMRMGRVN